MEFEIKLEKGNIATDWTPAPEDIQAEIDKNDINYYTHRKKKRPGVTLLAFKRPPYESVMIGLI